MIAEQRRAGKAVGYLSIPLTSTGGGNFNVNREVAESAKAADRKALRRRFHLGAQSDDAGRRPAEGQQRRRLHADVGRASSKGTDGLGDFDFVFFAGPQDFARYFGFDGNADMAKLDAFFDKRVKSDPDFEKAAQGGLTKAAFRKYYALRASASVSRGAHDEWNIVRLINERRRADCKLGTGNQIPMLFDGRAAAPPESEAPVSDGYVGKCADPEGERDVQRDARKKARDERGLTSNVWTFGFLSTSLDTALVPRKGLEPPQCRHR